MWHGTDDFSGGEILFGFTRGVDFGHNDFIGVLEGARKFEEQRLGA